MKITRRQLRKLIKEASLLLEMRAKSSKCINGKVHEEIVQDYYMDVDSLLVVMAKKSGKTLDFYKGAYEFAASKYPRQYGGTPAAVGDMMEMARALGMSDEEVREALYPEYYALMAKYPDGFMPTGQSC